MNIPNAMGSTTMTFNGRGRILIVDDEPDAVKVLSMILADDGYEVCSASDVQGAVSIVSEDNIDAVITDLKMPGSDGMQLFQYVSGVRPDIPVIFLTAYGTISNAVSAMNLGAFYYFIKPPDYLKLKSMLSRAVEQHRLKKEVAFLKSRLFPERKRHHIIARNPGMLRIVEIMEAVKDSPSSVHVCGETGTGKELVAKALHGMGKNGSRPFVAVNCAAIPRNLLESELFGCEKGAFTGATARRIGKIEEASRGVLFLDEISEMETSVQSKLLRVLQEREVQRLGGGRPVKVDFRLISSSNRDLRMEVKKGTFREDLFYRLGVIEICLPPLRERKEDIPLLTAEFVQEFCMREEKCLSVSPEVLDIFMQYHWPGNVRQLRNVIEGAVVLTAGDRITIRNLPEDFHAQRGSSVNSQGSLKTVREIELEAIRDSLKLNGGNKSRAARQLGISRKALYKRLSMIEPEAYGRIKQREKRKHEGSAEPAEI